MRPIQQLRYWARRAPLVERATAGVAAVIAVGLLAWLLVPAGGSSNDEQVATGPTVGNRTTTTLDPAATEVDEDPTDDLDLAAEGPDPATGSGGGGDGAGAGGGGPAEAGPEAGDGGGNGGGGGATGCVSPPGSMQGVSDDEVTVAIVLTEIVGPAANELFDVPTPDRAKAHFDAVVAGINGEGGVACRTLVPRYYIANPTDESQMMRLCRDIADDGLAAVMDTGSLATRPAVLACFGQLEVPYFGAFFISDKARRQFFPYIYSIYTLEHVYSSTAFALAELGFFDPANGFGKLGFAYRSCEREAVDAFRDWIREAGVPNDKVETYSVGCPAVFAAESDLAQAVQQFRSRGVTHVVMAAMQGDYQRFTELAELQRFRPRYGFPDEALISTAEGTRRAHPSNMAGALAITLARDGEQQTPGMAPTPGTQRCNAYYQAAGLPTVYEEASNAGNACSQLWMFKAALDNAPQLSHDALPAGLQQTGRIDFSFPQGIGDFSAPGTTSGGQHWRVAEYEPGCQRHCWRIIQPEFKRGWL